MADKDSTPSRQCSAPGCDRTAVRRGYCRAHAQQLFDYGFDAPRPLHVARQGCEIAGCEGKHFAKGKCQKHYAAAYLLERRRKGRAQ